MCIGSRVDFGSQFLLTTNRLCLRDTTDDLSVPTYRCHETGMLEIYPFFPRIHKVNLRDDMAPIHQRPQLDHSMREKRRKSLKCVSYKEP